MVSSEAVARRRSHTSTTLLCMGGHQRGYKAMVATLVHLQLLCASWIRTVRAFASVDWSISFRGHPSTIPAAFRV